MATTYPGNSEETAYYRKRPEIVKIFDDLDEYLAFCRNRMCAFNPAELYRKDSANYRAFLAHKKHKNRK